jgi:hypothetical protein
MIKIGYSYIPGTEETQNSFRFICEKRDLVNGMNILIQKKFQVTLISHFNIVRFQIFAMINFLKCLLI